MSAETDKKILETWNFSWPIMNVLVGGRSSIDLPDIQIRNIDEARAFIKSYGYDTQKTHDARLMHAAICESLNFIEHWLMPKEWRNGVQPPEEVLLCDDPCLLLVWASDKTPEHNFRRIWSCATLRVMHTIAHIEGAFRYSDIDVARDEIIARFQSIIVSDKRGDFWIRANDHSLKLHKLEWKTQKSRQSVLLKLLHKRANVAETIYDMIGLRIVTEHQADAIQLVKMLYKSHVISFPNAIPSRSRNSIMDLDVFKIQLDQMHAEFKAGKITSEEFSEKIDQMRVPPPADQKENLHSGIDYQAIQMTCRQLIRTPKPLTILRRNLEKELIKINPHDKAGHIIQELVSVLKNIARLSGDDEFSFFPFEIQIMDKESWVINTTGKASHSKYKKSQLKAARRRVLNEVLPLS